MSDPRIGIRSKGNTFSRKAKGSSGFTQVYLRYTRRAKERGYNWSLSRDEAKAIFTTNCYYCGIAPSQFQRIHNKECTIEGLKHAEFIYNGIDRIDNSQGYTVQNCVACCKTCNRAKDTMSVQEFYSWIERVHKNVSAK
jgi:hypothetical protein